MQTVKTVFRKKKENLEKKSFVNGLAGFEHKKIVY